MKRVTRRSLLAAGTLAPLAVPGQSLARMGGASAPVGVGPTPPGSPFVVTTTPGTLNNSNPGGLWRGYRMLVGSQPLTVTALGRWVVSGNTQSHNIAIYQYDANTGLSMQAFGSQVTLNTAGKPSNAYSYVSLSSTVVLWPGIQYWVLSQETDLGDQWLWHSDTSVTTTSDAVLQNAAAYNPSTGALADYDGYGTNKPDVPVNFQYNVGAPGGITMVGTPFVVETDSDHMFGSHAIGAVSGLLPLGMQPTYGPMPNGNIIGEWVVWSGGGTIVRRSGAMTSTQPPLSGHNLLEWTLDTTSLPDGTYVIYPLLLDHSASSLNGFVSAAAAVVVANSPPVSRAVQTIPVVTVQQSHEVPSALPDFLTYSGTPFPARPTYPLPYSFVKGANDPSSPYHSHPEDLRTMTNWYAEDAAPKMNEYQRVGTWATTPSGGIIMDYIDPLGYSSTPGSYDTIVALNTFSGTRCNSLVSPFTTYVEDPAGGGVWYGAELGGRLFKMHANGDIETIVGWERDKTVLPLMRNVGGPEEDITRILIGNFNLPVEDLGGLNDLCFDPRDSTHDTLFVVSQIDHFIAKVIISTKQVTIYAGSPGTSGYSGDGGPATSALFNNPSSIIMSDGTGNGGPAGTMYVTDCYNSAIRKITPTGTISTLYGGTVPPTILSMADVAVKTTYNVTSLVWSGGPTGSGVVTMAPTPATDIKLGFSIYVAGASNAGGGGNPNGIYVVTGFTNSQNFVVSNSPGVPFDQAPHLSDGTMTGTITILSQKGDVYSAPGTVSLVGGGAGWIPFCYSIRFTSNNNIVMTEMTQTTLRLIDLAANTAVRMGCYSDYFFVPAADQWAWVACDRLGTGGPIDDTHFIKFQDSIGAAHTTFRYSIDARWIGLIGYHGLFSSDSGQADRINTSYGPLANIRGLGHYPWAIAVSSTEGRMIGGGTAEFFATNCWITQPSNPPLDLNATLQTAGKVVNYSGTASCFPYGVRPALFSIWGSEAGNGFVLPMTFNDLMVGPYTSTTPGDAGDVALATFIQSGMGGAVPRPELTGNDLRNFIYYIRRSTVAGSVGPTIPQPGPTAADNAAPIILSATITRTGTGGTNIHAVWTTDKPTIGMLGGASSTQAAFGCYPIISALESVAGPSSYPTTHALDMVVPPFSMLSPVHVVIVVKDVAGNVSHTLDQAIT